MAQIAQVTKQTSGYGMPALDDITNLITVSNTTAANNVGTLSASGAIPVAAGTSFITAQSAAALTLAAPTAGAQISGGQDGIRLIVSSNTAFAHTVTTAGLLQTGTTAVNTATFAARAGASMELAAYGGKWNVISSNQITFS